jgi:hypothetical protein
MNTLCWNCRGTGLSRIVQELVTLVRVNCPSLVFLCETRNSENRVANLRWRLGLKNCIAVDSDGRSGGLALFWHESVEVNLLEKNSRYIDVSSRITQMILGLELPSCMVSRGRKIDISCGMPYDA